MSLHRTKQLHIILPLNGILHETAIRRHMAQLARHTKDFDFIILVFFNPSEPSGKHFVVTLSKTDVLTN